MHYFISGGAGFIGSNFVELLLSQSEHPVENITVYDKLTYSGNLRNLRDYISRPNFNFIEGDICNTDQVSKALFGVDYVVHFAAESHVDNSINHAGRFIETNVLGTQQVLEAAMRSGVRKFLNVSTDEVYGTLGLTEDRRFTENTPFEPNMPYAAAKAGVEGMSRSLARELGSRGITVNCVAPGFIDTDMTRSLGDSVTTGLLAQIPLGRLGRAAEVAHAVGFLCEADYVTGATIHVNGGMHMA
jgi:dTDP-glucose 4,6-dehydratase